jgi:hypothetical protein
MLKIPGLFRAAAPLLLAAAPPFCFATDTHVWEQNDPSDFGRGTSTHLSIRSDGHLTLAPTLKELDSTGVPYLWAIAEDSKSTLYYAGGAPTGATTKVFALPSKGKSKVFAELTGLEVHALAVDSQDRVYAAVTPDAKIYRIDASGKPQLFFDPKCKYVWAMAFDKSGNLFVATGDQGVVYKVSPDGKGTEFFKSDEAHARSMVFDADGNLIVGTEPSGLVFRVSPAGESFVLYQTNKREVTSVAVHDGVIYAASSGNKSPVGPAVPSPAPALPPATPPPTSTATVKIAAQAAAAAPPPASALLSSSLTGGSEFYRIQRDGFAEKIWSSSSELVYSIAFDRAGKPLLGTGNKGLIYRVDSDQFSTQLLDVPPTQVTALVPGRDGVIYAATANLGNLYAIGPGHEKTGVLESDVLDASDFAYWGKAHLKSTLHDGTVGMETRSGNVSRPQNNWSPWSKVNVSPLGGQIESPAARFLQYRLTFSSSPNGESPEVNLVDIAYLPKNIAPKIQQIEIAPFNYRLSPSASTLERSVLPSGSPTTLSLPAVGQRRGNPPALSMEGAGSSTLQYNKGFVTVRWSASDDNSDSLLFKVEIRGKDETLRRTLKDKLQDRYYAIDSAALPDGDYIVRVTASDSPSNTPADALTSSLESESFTVDNTPPEISGISVAKNGASRSVTFAAKDVLSWIDKAEYSVDGGEWTILNPVNRVTDSQTLQFKIDCRAQQLLSVRVFDEDDNVVVRQIPVQ